MGRREAFLRGAWVVVAWLATCLAFAGGPKPEPTRGPVKVFVTAKRAPTPLSPEALKAKQEKADALAQRFKELDKASQKQHGKRRDKWPVEARAAYFEALEAQNTAVTDLWYAAPDEKDKADSAQASGRPWAATRRSRRSPRTPGSP